jgi:hypothetical protein
MGRVAASAPLLKAGWPQQVCDSGISTLQPAASSKATAAKPTLGRIESTRQVTNRPTRGERGAFPPAFPSAFPRSGIGLSPSAAKSRRPYNEEFSMVK